MRAAARAAERTPADEPAPCSSAAEVLLPDADYNGTLAAVRSLGRAGVRVVVAGARRFEPALWSRHASRALACPDALATPRLFLDWLLDLGAREPGRVLYPTSDDMAWLFALHRDALAHDYRVSLPSFEAVRSLLDKWTLHRTCRALGIDTPDAWLPSGDPDVGRVARAVPYPVVIKPRTQAFLSPHQKGRIARDAGELAARWADFRRATRPSPLVLATAPGAATPIVQTYVEGAKDAIDNLSGFVDESGALFVAAASRKRLQWPRNLGIGLCFEELDVAPELAAKVARLCRHVGYHGAFEVEFLASGGRHLLIDFNPRFYGQMAFDVARGLDLPRLVYLAALGEREALRSAVAHARVAVRRNGERAHCDRIELELALGLLPLAGRLTRAERAAWRAWLRRHRERLSDTVLDRHDWAPAALVAAAAVVHRLEHPRATWRAARHG